MNSRVNETRFVVRTTLERRILAVVNGQLGQFAALNGLTDAAVHSWTYTLRQIENRCDLASVLSVLDEFATRAELKADESRDTFELTLRMPPAATDVLLDRLSVAANRTRAELGRLRST